MSQSTLATLVGSWLIAKLRRQQVTHGTRHAASLARKQGVPFELALAVFAGARPRRD